MGFLQKLFGDYSTKELKKIEPQVLDILNLETAMEKLTDNELKNKSTLLVIIGICYENLGNNKLSIIY